MSTTFFTMLASSGNDEGDVLSHILSKPPPVQQAAPLPSPVSTIKSQEHSKLPPYLPRQTFPPPIISATDTATSETVPTNVTATLPLSEDVHARLARERNLKKEQQRQQKKAAIWGQNVPPKEQITDVYPPELHNTWLRTGRAEMQGRRASMEDALTISVHFRSVISPLRSLSTKTASSTSLSSTLPPSDLEEVFIGVYDGHGGDKASEYVGRELHLIFKQKLELYEKLVAQHKQQKMSQALATNVLVAEPQPQQLQDAEPLVTQAAILKRIMKYIHAPLCETAIAAQKAKSKSVVLADTITESFSDDDDDDDENNSNDDENSTHNDNKQDMAVDDASSDAKSFGSSSLDDSTLRFDQDKNLSLKFQNSIEHIDLLRLPEQEAILLLLRESFVEVNDTMRETKVPAGTTASVAYFVPHRKLCYIANVGDSRILLVRNGERHRLTVDHRPNDPDEEARVKATGGYVANSRVNGMLAVTRALGDCFLEPMVTADPFTMCLELNDQDEYMIIACDGVWDFVSDQKACSIVENELDPRVASVKLRDFAYNCGSSDNISVCVVRFNHSMQKLQVKLQQQQLAQQPEKN